MPGTGVIIFLPQRFARYGLLVGTITAGCCGTFAFLLRIRSPVSCTAVVPARQWRCFVAGDYSDGVITGLVNISNTYGAIRGTDVFIRSRARGIHVIVAALWRPDYDADNRAAGGNSIFTVCFILGLLTQTGDYTRRSFIYGSVFACWWRWFRHSHDCFAVSLYRE